LVRRHEQKLVLELLVTSIRAVLLLDIDRTGYIYRRDATHSSGCLRSRHRCKVTICSHKIEIVESFGYFAQLILVLLVVERGANWLDRLVALSLAILRHEYDLILFTIIYVIKWLAKDNFLFEQ